MRPIGMTVAEPTTAPWQYRSARRANAGTAIPKPFEGAALEELNRVTGINISGVFVTMRETLKHMNDNGRIIMTVLAG
jgi:NADP-dependent 3-hydroxy acid dehydrogenase YdfG